MSSSSTTRIVFALFSIFIVLMMTGIGIARILDADYTTGLFYLLGAAILVGTAALAGQLALRSLPRAFNVAIIGYPRSGKTTLITAMFGEIFARKVRGVDIRPEGASTIERVNADLAMLAKGRALGPTTAQDRRSYSTRVQIGRHIYKRAYRVEFGDFPGEDSKEYLENYGPWLHTTSFFKWAMESDALIFVVDLGDYILEKRGVPTQCVTMADLSAGIRAAWQQYAGSGLRRRTAARDCPIVLAFAKADMIDLLLHIQGIASDHIDRSVEKVDPDNEDAISKAVLRLGFGAELRPPIEIYPDDLAIARRIIEEDFAELIDYLRGETRRFRVVYTSGIGVMNGRRLGIDELLRAVLAY